MKRAHEELQAEIVPTAFWTALIVASIITWFSRFPEPLQLYVTFCMVFTTVALGMAVVMSLVLWPLFLLLDKVFGP